MPLSMTLQEYFEVVSRIQKETQKAIDAAHAMRETERIRIDDHIGKLSILSFGIVSAVLALNGGLGLQNLLVMLGMLVLVANALWNFIVQDDQMRTTRDFAEKRLTYVTASLDELLQEYRKLVEEPIAQREQEFEKAVQIFFEKFNERGTIRSPQTPLARWIGRRAYFGIFTAGLLLIGLGFLFPLRVSRARPTYERGSPAWSDDSGTGRYQDEQGRQEQ